MLFNYKKPVICFLQKGSHVTSSTEIIIYNVHTIFHTVHTILGSILDLMYASLNLCVLWLIYTRVCENLLLWPCMSDEDRFWHTSNFHRAFQTLLTNRCKLTHHYFNSVNIINYSYKIRAYFMLRSTVQVKPVMSDDDMLYVGRQLFVTGQFKTPESAKHNICLKLMWAYPLGYDSTTQCS